jgi:hypothetical protein
MITIRARPAGAPSAFSWHVVSKLVRMDDMPVNRPPVIRDQDRVDVRLTEEAEYRIPFTFIEALNEGTLADRPAHAFLDAARERRLFHVLNRTTDNIIGTQATNLRFLCRSGRHLNDASCSTRPRAVLASRRS